LKLKELDFDGDTPIIENTLSNNIDIRLYGLMKMEELDSEEEPEFDEAPIETSVPSS